MPRAADLSDESLLLQTVPFVYSRGFLQHNCSTQGEKDF